MFMNIFNGAGKDLTGMVASSVEELEQREWIVEEEGRFRLTETGKEQALIMLEEIKKGGRFLDAATRPETVSKVTMIVHFILGAIKLPAALLSGSVGLLNDSLDTIMDGISSLFVFFGIKSGRERLVSFILLAFMTATGLFSLFEAVRHIVTPGPLQSDPLTFTAVAVSALLCAGLWFYQKFAGLKHNCVPLIAQSLDSRNHILVAGGVTAGLIASALHFPFIDHLVGILVAVLILKGAIELLIELIKSEGEEGIDLSKYGFKRFEQHRQEQFIRWLLYEIERGEITSKESMKQEARVATDFSRVETFKALGIEQQTNRDEMIETVVEAVFTRGLAREVPFELTEKGKEELQQALSDSIVSPGGGSSLSTAGLWRVIVRGIGFVIRLALNGILFIGLFLLIHLFLELLPTAYLWTGFEPIIGAAGTSLSLPETVLFLFGFLLFWYGRRLVHRAHHSRPHRRPGNEKYPRFLTTSGAYRDKRHPLYAGMICIQTGVGIASNSLYLLLLALLLLVFLVISALREENRLIERFETEYRTYRDRVTVRLHPWYMWTIIAAGYIAAGTGLLL
jgi:protein-S-isoprenylcysteine O-methyltransferase Ste14